MARAWQYTRSRRTMMQGVMWLILGGTVGLAALVDRYRDSPQNISLGPTLSSRYFTLRPPAGWRQGTDGGGRLVFVEPGADPANKQQNTGRWLAVEVDRLRGLKLGRYLSSKAGQVGPRGHEEGQIVMCGQPGLMATVQEPTILPDGQRAPEGWSVLACTILSNGPGVTLQLHTPRRPTAADMALVKAVAQAMTPPPPADEPDGQ